MLKIVLIGPESTGKSTLAAQLAEYYNTTWVKEYAREYIDDLNRPYDEKDLLRIAEGQIGMEEIVLSTNYPLVFFDTNLIVLKVWSLNAYGRCNHWILEQIEKRSYDLYFLCGIDVPWEFDEQREHPNMRAYFYEIYKNELMNMDVNFVELSGNETERLNTAIEIIKNKKRED